MNDSQDSTSGSCFNCGTTVDSDYYCHGCHTFICGECEAGYSVAAATMGPHAATDHLQEHEADDRDVPLREVEIATGCTPDGSPGELESLYEAGRRADPWPENG